MHFSVVNFSSVFIRKPFGTNRTRKLFLYAALIVEVFVQISFSFHALVGSTTIIWTVYGIRYGGGNC